MLAPGQTAANYIFTERFHALIPRSFMYGEEYIRKVGYASAGEREVDRMQASSLENQHQTIAGLAYLYWQGAEPLLANANDMIPIYRAIIQHLTDWRDFSGQGLNPAFCPPIEDFRALENLALHYHYRVQEMEPTPQNKDRMVNAIMAMNRSGNRTVVRENTRMGDNTTIRPFISIADDIERNIYGD